jgi:transforming growth factor-beta-induced protein
VPQLAKSLATTANITILAPSNQAFSKLSITMPNVLAMTNNSDFVTGLLEYHVLSGLFPSTRITTTPIFASSMLTVASTTSNLSMQAPGIRKQEVGLVTENNVLMAISGFKQMSMITKADVKFDGGIIHIVDTVLTEPDSTSVTALDTGLTSLAGALVQTKMLASVDALKQATIFAPSNAGFSAVGAVVENGGSKLFLNHFAAPSLQPEMIFRSHKSAITARVSCARLLADNGCNR